uniref:Zinc finger protein 236 n=1 Tax=Schistocephalus solidus TaxID=70667 RepID=A0A0X3PJ05_SCHSO
MIPSRSLCCRLCNASISSVGTLRKHYRLCHPGNPKKPTLKSQPIARSPPVRTSPPADLTTSTERAYRKSKLAAVESFKKASSHLRRKKGKDGEFSSVPTNLSSITNLSDLDVYIQKVPKTRKRCIFVCLLCNKKASSFYAARRHLSTHTGAKPYSCPICSKSFTQMSSVKTHIVLHNDAGRFHCEYCSKIFNYEHNLNAHVWRHHRNIQNLRDSQNTDCTVETCQKNLTVFDLKRVNLSVFSAITTILSVLSSSLHGFNLRFHCRYCFFSFKHKSTLHLHQRLHLNDLGFFASVLLHPNIGADFYASRYRNRKVLIIHSKTKTLFTSSSALFEHHQTHPRLFELLESTQRKRSHANLCNKITNAVNTCLFRKRLARLHASVPGFGYASPCECTKRVNRLNLRRQQLKDLIRQTIPFTRTCAVCFLALPNSRIAACHLVSHFLSQNCICPLCNRKFHCFSVCLLHLTIVHRRPKLYPFFECSETLPEFIRENLASSACTTFFRTENNKKSPHKLSSKIFYENVSSQSQELPDVRQVNQFTVPENDASRNSFPAYLQDASHQYIEPDPTNSCPQATNMPELPPVDELLQSTQPFDDFNETEPVLAEEATWLGPVIATSIAQPHLNQSTFVILPSDSSIPGFVQADPNSLATDEPVGMVSDLARGPVPVVDNVAASSAPFILGQTVYELQSGDIFVLPQGKALGQVEDYSPRIFCGETFSYVDTQNLPQLQVFESDLSSLELRGDYETIESANFDRSGGDHLARLDPACEVDILTGGSSAHFVQTDPGSHEQTHLQPFVQENVMPSLPTVAPTEALLPIASQKDVLTLSQNNFGHPQPISAYHVIRQDIPIPTELPNTALFGCLHCSSQFITASELQIHASTHSIATEVAVCTVCFAAQPCPQKDEFCPVCGQNGFQEAQNSYTLFNSAADGCRFYCAHCSQTFLDIASLDLHIAHLSNGEPGKVLTQTCIQVKADLTENPPIIDQPSPPPSSHIHMQQQDPKLSDVPATHLGGNDRSKNSLQLSEEQIQKLMQLEPTRTNSLSERLLIEAANRRFTASYPKPNPIQTVTSPGNNPGEKEKRSVVCTLCSHRFRRSSDLRRHMFLHSGVRPYGCDFCSRRFIIQGRMLQHMIKAHGESGNARAAQYSFSRRRYLQRLIRLQRTFTTPQKFTCHVCGAVCRTLTGLRGHVRAHTNTNIYACPHCNRAFRSSMQRKRHLRVCPSNRTESHPIEVEVAPPPPLPPQQRVMPVLERDPTGMANCQLASEVTVNIVDLDQQHVYPEGESHFDLANYFLEVNESENKVKPASWLSPAEQVGERLDAIQVYRPVGFTDLLMTDSADPQGFECIELNEAVAEAASHSREQVESSADPPSARRRHRVPYIPHNDSDRTREDAGTFDQSRDSADAHYVPWWQCKQCKESFASGRLFLCHPCVCGKQDVFPRLRTLQRATVVPLRGSGERSVQCVDCTKTFPTPTELRRHARTHSQERPFICTTCGAAFSQAGSLARHERTHSKEDGRIYRCRFCSSKFVQKCNMFRHMTRKHGVTRLTSKK